ncbi:PqqD family peptide modification chaperone [Yoonia sp.]|uniref:PqqD family peptide modification chaperone n=1 Tax=Yoonia sp. TaxID=2212373 RepID=UPI002FDA2B1B
MQTRDIQFSGLAHPVRIVSPDEVIPILAPVVAAWPIVQSGKADAPFATVGPTGDGRSWRLSAPRAVRPEVEHNPVNAICDLIVEMSWERLRSRPDLLCLHAAAVAFGDRLVIFPNQRRAGKSLLSASLARHGHAIFTDDFIPLAVDPATGVISGVANGIAPRLRLPLPETVSSDFAAWIETRIAVRNRQYGYLAGIDLPTSGTEMPVGAIVMLDRDMEMTGPAELTPVSADAALAAIVTQNFGRQVHAGAILAITGAMATTVPVLRLTYRDVEEATALLEGSPLLAGLPAATVPADAEHPPTRPAPLERLHDRPQDVADIKATFARIAGFTEVETAEAIYLASATGLAIHRLNPVSAMIWKLLEDPLEAETVIAVLGDLFTDVPRDQLAGDVAAALTFMFRDGLIRQAG